MKIKVLESIKSQNPSELSCSQEELANEVLKYHMGKTFAEIKEDGYRAQIHKKGDVVKAYTRSQNELMLELFPELHSSLKNLPDCVLDAELTGDGKIGGEAFKIIQSRFRHNIDESAVKAYLASDIVEDKPLTLRVFDTLHWEGQDLIDKPLSERRNYTEGIYEAKIIPSNGQIFTDYDSLNNHFTGLLDKKYEGLVSKNPDSLYLPGKKTKDWIKMKREETLDLVILGAYFRQGKLHKILCGSYNNKEGRYETLCKVNATKDWNAEILGMIEGNFLDQEPSNVYLNSRINNAKKVPDYFVNPENAPIVEVSTLNIQKTKNWQSCGLDDTGLSYSLRIPKLKGLRPDKALEDITNVSQVKSMYIQSLSS